MIKNGLPEEKWQELTKGICTVMETVMVGIDKHAAFYRAYLPADRSLVPMSIALATIVALWFFVYLVIAVGPQTEAVTARPGSHPTPIALQSETR
jgi:hypothetical protein